MKKFVMGLLFGAVLSFTVSAHAEEIKSLIGKQVDGQAAVVLDGAELPVQAVIIEGTSYAPLRAVGEAVGKTVDWKEGKVTMDTVVEQLTKEQLLDAIEYMKRNVASEEYVYDRTEGFEKDLHLKQLNAAKQSLADYERQLSELEAE